METLTQSTTLSMNSIGLMLGFLLVASHAAGLVLPGPAIAAAKSFPRSRFWGTLLLALAVFWTLWIAGTTDLGEFSPMRRLIVMGTAAGGFLLWKFVPDFLSSRSLGFLLLLAAQPVLESTFLLHGTLKLALAFLAYAWALAGLFLVGMPYLHRDLIGWICAERWHWNAACWAGILYGILLLGATQMG